MDLILKILKILWRIIRALLIIILAVAGMVISVVIWPLYIFAAIFCPTISAYVLVKIHTTNVW